MSTARRAPWWVLVAALVVCALVLFGPLWGSYLGENPLDRPSGPDYDAIVRLAAPTLVLSVVLLGSMVWARVRAGTRSATDGGSAGDRD